jgi:hypothetical protein
MRLVDFSRFTLSLCYHDGLADINPKRDIALSVLVIKQL